MPLEHDPRKRRIAVVGESSGFMIERSLERMIGKLPCADRYELIQCSTPGGNLPLVERRFDEALAYSPDAILVLVGHNLYFSMPTDPWRLRLERLRLASRLLSRLLRPTTTPPPPDPEAALRSLDRALRRFGRESRARGVSLIVSTMASNLWFAPAASLDERRDPRYLEALFAHEIGGSDEAIRLLRRLTDERGPRAAAAWHFQLASWLYESGDYTAARDEFLVAADTDRTRFRASRAVNDVIRTAAREIGFTVRDSEEELRLRSEHGIPGWDDFVDNCHLAAITREAGAELLMIPGYPDCSSDGVRDALIESEAIDWRTHLQRRFEAILRQATGANGANAEIWLANFPGFVANSIARLGPSAEQDIESVLDGGEALSGLAPALRAEALLRIADGLWQAGRRDKALAINERVRASGPWDEAWVQKALFHLRSDQRDAARSALEKALALRPDRPDARFFLDRLARAR